MSNVVQLKGTGPPQRATPPQAKREVPWQFHFFMGTIVLLLGLIATGILVIEDLERLSNNGEKGYVFLYGIAVVVLMLKWFVHEIYHEEFAEAIGSIAGLCFYHAYNVSLESAYQSSHEHVAKWQVAMFSAVLPETWAHHLATLIAIVLLLAFVVISDRMGKVGTQMLFKAFDERAVEKKRARQKAARTRKTRAAQ